MKTHIYIDGFNLYYGALKDTKFKWLDLAKFFSNILPKNNVEHVNYFTAKVRPRDNDTQIHVRQQAYLDALQALYPNKVSIYYGHFAQNKCRMPLAKSPHNTMEVIKTEEKGSDVNLSTHLLNDAWLDKYECAVIVSNDSDMAEAMKLVKAHHPGKRLGLINPREGRASDRLRKHADFTKNIRKNMLKNSQLPDPIPNSTIEKPVSWR